MDVKELYRHVQSRLRDDLITPKQWTHAVVTTLAEHLTPDDAHDLGEELPHELSDILAHAAGTDPLDRDRFVEDLAARLDLDDDEAERGAVAVLGAIREYLEPLVEIDQILETLPPDLQSLMSPH